MKNKKNIMLCRLAYAGRIQNVSIPPVGVAYLSEELLQRGIEHEVCDLGLHPQKHEKELLFKAIREKKPDILGLSMMTLGYKYHYDLFSELKKKFPSLIIVLGGSHMSTFREKVLEECPAIDYGIAMEGEYSFADLCEGKDSTGIKGLYYCSKDKVLSKGAPEVLNNIDNIAFPRYDKFPISNYCREIPLVTSRGCPYTCSYCPVATSIGRKFRARSPQSMLKEVKYWHEKGYRRFYIWDDNFTLIRNRVVQFCELLKASGLNDLYFGIPNGVRADRLDEDLLRRMWGVGFRQLSIGVESASDHVLANMQKHETVRQIEDAIRISVKLGYEVYLYFIIGLPGETYSDFCLSKKLAQKYKVAESRFYNLVPFPGTPLYDWAVKNSYLLKPAAIYLNRDYHFDNRPNIETPEMGVEERKKAFIEGERITKQQRIRFRTKQLKNLAFVARTVAVFTFSRLYQSLFKTAAFRKYVTNPFKNIFIKG